MIRVHKQPEPSDFLTKVKIPGRRALQELIGNPTPNKKGRKRTKIQSNYEDSDISVEDVTSKHLSKKTHYWTRCLDDLCKAYQNTCAYTALYVGNTGNRSVDHYIPKEGTLRPHIGAAEDPHMIFEWDNYRLSCRDINAQKGSKILTLDPFKVEDCWFELDPVSYQIIVTNDAPVQLRDAILDDINNKLALNDQSWCDARRDAINKLLDDEWRVIARHARKSPFLARALNNPQKMAVIVADLKRDDRDEVQRG